jgi:hypothetical protein
MPPLRIPPAPVFRSLLEAARYKGAYGAVASEAVPGFRPAD